MAVKCNSRNSARVKTNRNIFQIFDECMAVTPEMHQALEVPVFSGSGSFLALLHQGNHERLELWFRATTTRRGVLLHQGAEGNPLTAPYVSR